jgi:hypothetical protein
LESIRSMVSDYGISLRAGLSVIRCKMRRPACRYRTGAKARVYIPAGCAVRNMAEKNGK